ncbi:MAG: hypothetical protein N2112_15945 [Gemmataceae bacterium]|jgi:hypothetical protein|nr:hypothetical protein [Gemmataceae bacterium]
MMRRYVIALAILTGLFLAAPSTSQAKEPPLPRWYYYPYSYFPHNYWPTYSPQYPEPLGQPYQRPPAYMAYPPFKEPNWRYELWQNQKYYRGNHFWLDQF